jgi:hypothetical protein
LKLLKSSHRYTALPHCCIRGGKLQDMNSRGNLEVKTAGSSVLKQRVDEQVSFLSASYSINTSDEAQLWHLYYIFQCVSTPWSSVIREPPSSRASASASHRTLVHPNQPFILPDIPPVIWMTQILIPPRPHPQHQRRQHRGRYYLWQRLILDALHPIWTRMRRGRISTAAQPCKSLDTVEGGGR